MNKNILKIEKDRLKEMIKLVEKKSIVVRDYKKCEVCLESKKIYKMAGAETPCHYCRNEGIEDRCHAIGNALYANLGIEVFCVAWDKKNWKGFGNFEIADEYKPVFLMKLREFLKIVEELLK